MERSGGLLSWSASTVLQPPRRRGETKTAFEPQSGEAGREKGFDLFHDLAVRRFRQRPWRHPLAPLEQVSEADVLPVSQKRPDKNRSGGGGGPEPFCLCDVEGTLHIRRLVLAREGCRVGSAM